MSFDIDEIKNLIKEILHNKLHEKEFFYENIRQWNIDILNEIFHRLEEKNFHQQMKYIVTILIGEKIGLHTALSCLWDGTTDGCLTVKWENKNLFSIINVFGLAI